MYVNVIFENDARLKSAMGNDAVYRKVIDREDRTRYKFLYDMEVGEYAYCVEWAFSSSFTSYKSGHSKDYKVVTRLTKNLWVVFDVDKEERSLDFYTFLYKFLKGDYDMPIENEKTNKNINKTYVFRVKNQYGAEAYIRAFNHKQVADYIATIWSVNCKFTVTGNSETHTYMIAKDITSKEEKVFAHLIGTC